MCREHGLPIGNLSSQFGSSPHALGNTPVTDRKPPAPTVHPHMRGEHAGQVCGVIACSGSSPHAWGTRRWQRGRTGLPRFIPTCVGNTGSHRPPYGHAPVHPHMRGEHAQYLPGDLQGPRFIPTCVGNTCPTRWPMPLAPVHPHMRGEHSVARRTGRCCAGSSPHAWGTRIPLGPGQHAHRFIPTCVGNTV